MNEFKMSYNKFYLGDNELNPLAIISWTKLTNQNVININHTYVHPSLRGQNIGSRLVKRVVEYARDHNLKITSSCSYASIQLKNNDSYQDVKN